MGGHLLMELLIVAGVAPQKDPFGLSCLQDTPQRKGVNRGIEKPYVPAWPLAGLRPICNYDEGQLIMQGPASPPRPKVAHGLAGANVIDLNEHIQIQGRELPTSTIRWIRLTLG